MRVFKEKPGQVNRARVVHTKKSKGKRKVGGGYSRWSNVAPGRGDGGRPRKVGVCGELSEPEELLCDSWPEESGGARKLGESSVSAPVSSSRAS